MVLTESLTRGHKNNNGWGVAKDVNKAKEWSKQWHRDTNKHRQDLTNSKQNKITTRNISQQRRSNFKKNNGTNTNCATVNCVCGSI